MMLYKQKERHGRNKTVARIQIPNSLYKLKHPHSSSPRMISFEDYYHSLLSSQLLHLSQSTSSVLTDKENQSWRISRLRLAEREREKPSILFRGVEICDYSTTEYRGLTIKSDQWGGLISERGFQCVLKEGYPQLKVMNPIPRRGRKK